MPSHIILTLTTLLIHSSWINPLFSYIFLPQALHCIFRDTVAAAAKSLQSCPTLCDPIDGSPSGSPSLGFSRQEHWSGLPCPSPTQESKVKVKSLSRVWLLAIPWTTAYQAPPSIGFSRQEYWSGVPMPSPRDTVVNQINTVPRVLSLS